MAHQSGSLVVRARCDSELACNDLPVTIRELGDRAEPRVLAKGSIRMSDGEGSATLQVTLDRAGARVVEVSIEAPEGDMIVDNNRRFLVFDVVRERVRLLHIAGRPTYDARALRNWLNV